MTDQWHHPGRCLLPLLFVLIIYHLIEILKTFEDPAEILYYMDDLKVSREGLERAMQVNETVKQYAQSFWMGIDIKKSAIQLNTEIPTQSLQNIPQLDEVTYKYLGFEM